jgi:Leucine-rich repeat (LRR) protein
VVSLSIDVGDVLTDLSPLRAFPHLRSLSIKSSPRQSWLTDLSPLAGLPLEDLLLHRVQASDLAPLKGMPLKSLDLLDMPVTDLTPLAGMPLRSLTLFHISAADLSPLEGMKLTTLTLKYTRVSDLTPLQGMPLTELYLMRSHVSDLSPLAGMPLETLDLSANWSVSDLTPLKGMPLKTLGCNVTAVSDLSPLEGMPLKSLNIHGTRVLDLSPLAGIKLTRLFFAQTRVSDLSPLTGMPLTELNFTQTDVSDLSPLKGMPLKALNCSHTRVSDLSPLKGMPLESLRFSAVSEENLQIVRGIESLKQINDKLAAEFWKETETRGEQPPATEPADDASTTSPNEQAEQTREELRRRNPDFQGVITYLVEGGQVVRWSIVDGALPDLSPLLALEHLKELNYAAFDPERDAPVVRQLTSLEKINDDSAASYRLAYPANKPPRGVSDEWLATLAKLPVKSRVGVVMEKLQELNPNFDGKHWFREGDMFLRIESMAVTDLSPLKALPELRQLVCSGLFGKRTWLADLSPLSGIPLTRLECANTRVADLAPLKGMPLENLILAGTPVADLGPLAGMPLTKLHVNWHAGRGSGTRGRCKVAVPELRQHQDRRSRAAERDAAGRTLLLWDADL